MWDVVDSRSANKASDQGLVSLAEFHKSSEKGKDSTLKEVKRHEYREEKNQRRKRAT